MIANPITISKLEALREAPIHAIGLYGAKGSGKTFSGLWLASRLLGLKNKRVQDYSNFMHIDCDDDDIGIEKIREIQKFLSLTVPGPNIIKRAVLISNSESLRHEAQNALLKILEEPPIDSVIILTSSQKNKLLTTIQSRTVWIDVRPISLNQAKSQLESKYSIMDIEKSWRISQGNTGLLISLLDEKEGHPLALSIELAKSILAKTSYERLALIEDLLKEKNTNMTLLLDSFYKILHAAEMSAIEKDADKKLIIKIEQKLERVINAKELLRFNVNPKLILTELFYTL